MDNKHIEQMRSRSALARYTARVTKEIDSARTDRHGHDGHAMESVRTAEHDGHSIVVRTRYEIEVDRKPVVSPLIVDNYGRVASHALPNYTFLSAIDFVKQLIDTFPEDFSTEHGVSAHRRRAAKPRGSVRKKSKAAKQRQPVKARAKAPPKRGGTAKK